MLTWTRSPDHLAQRAAAGDRRAFRSLYRRLHPVVWSYVRRRVPDDTEAEDLVAQVFQRLVEHLHTFDAERGAVRAWAITMARNLVVDWSRRRGRTVGVAEVDALVDPDRGADARVELDEQARLVSELLEDVPLEVRRLLALRFADGLKYREIAELTGSTEAAVKQRFSRTLRQLREQTTRREREGALHAT